MESFLDKLLTDVADTRVPVDESPTDRPHGGRGHARQAAGTADRSRQASSPEAASDEAVSSRTAPVPRTGAGGEGLPVAPAGPAAPRIAIYDTLTSPPRVVAVEEEDLPALIASLAEKTYHHCREQGGQVPYTVIQELIENLLHAYFQDVVVTILDNGQTLRISDHGPGLDDKERAFQPGFTTATPTQRQVIRGVGSGLPIARESLQFLRGLLTVEDNLGGGAVFTIRLPQRQQPAPAEPAAAPLPRLTTRQKKVLVLLMELGAAGPTQVGREIGVAPSTAFRELGLLEQMGLIHSLGDGKRALREEGLRLLDTLV